MKKIEDFEYITMLRNEKNLDTIRKIVSLQANMQLNAEQYNAALITREVYTENVATTQTTLEKILFDTKKDLDYLANYEKETYEALRNKNES